MFHRGFFLGRLIMLLLLIGVGMVVTRGAFRSGYEQGFVRGMAFSAVDGQASPGQTAPESAARPPAYGGFDGGWGHGGMRPFHGGGVMAFVIVVFAMMAIMKGIAWRHWAHHGPGRHGEWGHSRHGRWGHHGHGSRPDDRDRPDGVGPEKQPEDYL